MSPAALQGASPGTVRAAIDAGDPLPGTRGFAGELDGALVRDTLGRYPLYLEADDPTAWSPDPTRLEAPTPLPAGHVRDEAGERRVWSIPDPAPVATEAAVGEIREAIRTSTAEIDTEGLAVAFSGGLDSGILAARLDAPLYVVGFPGSHDVAAARSAADRLGADLRVVDLDAGTLEAAVPTVARATGRRNAMDLSIALPLFLLSERVAADGFERLALGQGADELFGGYAKVADPAGDSRLEAETVRGARREVLQTLPEGLPRDVLAVRAGGLEPVFPLLHDRVIGAALALPGDGLVSPAGERKHALRLAAREWLPDAVAFREKKALQYGSLASRELDRLAREAGFKRRRDDHVGEYVASRLE